MKLKLRKVIDSTIYRHHTKELEDRLSIIFLLAGLILSSLGFITSIIFGVPFWMNISNLLVLFICLFVILFSEDKLEKYTKMVVFVVGFLFFPFVFFTTGGINGGAPLYFVMIIIYISFYFDSKKVLAMSTTIITYYIIIIVIGYLYPETIIPYEDELTRLIDVSIAVFSVSIVLTVLGTTTFGGFRNERKSVVLLNEKLLKSYDELKAISIRDQLTNVFNRTYMLEVLEKEIEFTNEQDKVFYFLMIDLDSFKIINDTHGHLFGDTVLKNVAETIRNCTRKHDCVARYGGEEFATIVTHTSKVTGIEIAERIRREVAKLEFRYDTKVTVSIGLTKSIKGDSVLNIIKRADDKLYKAKDSGKNKVCE